MKYILADFHLHSDFLPFTYTKPLAELRAGILSFRERWNRFSGKLFESSGEEYMLPKYPCSKEGDLLVVCASLIPSKRLYDEILQLNSGERLQAEGIILAYRAEELLSLEQAQGLNSIEYQGDYLLLEHPWELFSKNKEILAYDFDLLTRDRVSQSLSDTNTVLGDRNQIFLEEGARVECSILNSTGRAHLYRKKRPNHGRLHRSWRDGTL